MSNTRWTRDDLRRKGFVPDSGGVVRLPAAEWDSRHGRTYSDFDNGGGEGPAGEAVNDGQYTRCESPGSCGTPRGTARRVAPNREPVLPSRNQARPVVNPHPAIRVPKRSGPNATEKRWFADNWMRWASLDVDMHCRYEAVSFRLASSALYTPDYTIWAGDRLCVAVEVKGAWGHGSHSRSALAFKTASAEWPAIRWIWAQWKNNQWFETEILPK